MSVSFSFERSFTPSAAECSHVPHFCTVKKKKKQKKKHESAVRILLFAVLSKKQVRFPVVFVHSKSPQKTPFLRQDGALFLRSRRQSSPRRNSHKQTVFISFMAWKIKSPAWIYHILCPVTTTSWKIGRKRLVNQFHFVCESWCCQSSSYFLDFFISTVVERIKSIQIRHHLQLKPIGGH